MPHPRSDSRVDLVERLTQACGVEIGRRDPDAVIPWPQMPTVGAVAVHLGVVHRWVTAVLRTRSAAEQPEALGPTGGPLPAWFAAGRLALIEVLTEVPPHESCWVLGDRIGTAAFWRRRMVFEHVKHLVDLRAAGGGIRVLPEELVPEEYADGVDELLSEFLPRSRPRLPRLPGSVVLEATDVDRAWRIGADWAVSAGAQAASATVRARTGDLALVLWERADPLALDRRFRVEGDRDLVAALRDASIHPW